MEPNERDPVELERLTEILRPLGFLPVPDHEWCFYHQEHAQVQIDFSAVAFEPYSVMYTVLKVHAEYYRELGRLEVQNQIKDVLGLRNN